MPSPSLRLTYDTASAQRLHAVGLSVTLSRLAVLELLSESPCAMDVASMHRALLMRGLTVPLSSIYTTVHRLQAAGLLERHLTDGNKGMFACAQQRTRHRLTCTRCGRVSWLDDSPQLASLIAQGCREQGVQMQAYAVSIQGECADGCAQTTTGPREAPAGRVASRSAAASPTPATALP